MQQLRHIVKSEEEQFVMGEVYVANDEDTDGDQMSPDEVRRMCHNFMLSGGFDKIDRGHDKQKSGNLVVENFFVGSSDHPDGWRKNSWVMGAYILNPDDWAAVKKGDWNGWSWGGKGAEVRVIKRTRVPIKMAGTTELHPISDGHYHEIEAKFDSAGKLIPTRTSIVDDHSHEVRHMTATEQESGHSHRLVGNDP